MKPLLRGYIHQAAFYIAIYACAILVYHSHTTHAIVANLIYSISLVGLFGISALYHCPMWGPRAYIVIKHIDHVAIFGLIAGTTTPICVIGIGGPIGKEILLLVWVYAIIGMLITLFWIHSPKGVRALLYVSAGWLAIPYFHTLKSSLGVHNLWLLLTGGIIYTIGAIIYSCKWPNPFPRVFGYHEIFHLLIVIAAAVQFDVIYRLVA